MAGSPRYVLDATVANKWHLTDEEHVGIADQIRQDFEDDRIGLVAPTQLRFEVAAALLKATRNPDRVHRLDPRLGVRMLEVFDAWNIVYFPSETLMMPAFRLAQQYGCSYYDGLYVALAQTLGIPLLHADNKLRRSLGTDFPLSAWIESYSSPS